MPGKDSSPAHQPSGRRARQSLPSPHTSSGLPHPLLPHHPSLPPSLPMGQLLPERGQTQRTVLAGGSSSAGAGKRQRGVSCTHGTASDRGQGKSWGLGAAGLRAGCRGSPQGQPGRESWAAPRATQRAGALEAAGGAGRCLREPRSAAGWWDSCQARARARKSNSAGGLRPTPRTPPPVQKDNSKL